MPHCHQQLKPLHHNIKPYGFLSITTLRSNNEKHVSEHTSQFLIDTQALKPATPSLLLIFISFHLCRNLFTPCPLTNLIKTCLGA